MNLGLGYRRGMRNWDLNRLPIDFMEVAPENYIGRSLKPLHEIRESGMRLKLHGLSLNLGGLGPLNLNLLDSVKSMMTELGITEYSEHLSATGDELGLLYELLPIPFTESEVTRVADRISRVQDYLGFQLPVENASYYTNVGDMSETEFYNAILERSDCLSLLDINNATVNETNHGDRASDFIKSISPDRIAYCHIAGHIIEDGMAIDTHGTDLKPNIFPLIALTEQHAGRQLDVLVERDSNLPTYDRMEYDLWTYKRYVDIFAEVPNPLDTRTVAWPFTSG